MALTRGPGGVSVSAQSSRPAGAPCVSRLRYRNTSATLKTSARRRDGACPSLPCPRHLPRVTWPWARHRCWPPATRWGERRLLCTLRRPRPRRCGRCGSGGPARPSRRISPAIRHRGVLRSGHQSSGVPRSVIPRTDSADRANRRVSGPRPALPPATVGHRRCTRPLTRSRCTVPVNCCAHRRTDGQHRYKPSVRHI